MQRASNTFTARKESDLIKSRKRMFTTPYSSAQHSLKNYIHRKTVDVQYKQPAMQEQTGIH